MGSAVEAQPHISHSATNSDDSKFSVGDRFEDNPDRPSVSDSSTNLQPPAVQSMEHTSAGNGPGYRIPSSVFARPPTAQGDWSTASNESLFSIQMGTMSFTREFAQYLGKSGELGTFKSGELGMYKKSRELSMYTKSGELSVPGEPQDMRPTTTGQMMNLSNCPQSAYQECSNPHPGFDLAAAAETMKEVIRENEQSRCEIKVSSQKSGTTSDDDGASVYSFAFPVSGDSVKSGTEDISLKPLNSSQQRKQTPASTPQATSIKEEASNAAQPAQATSWFSCFSCLPAKKGISG